VGLSGVERLQQAWANEDLDALIDLLDPQVTWTWWQPRPVCRNRDDVSRTFREVVAAGVRAHPEIVARAGDQFVVDPHPDPPPAFAPEIHHVYTFRDDRIVRIEDFRDRRSALEAVGLA
jgi:ketosteroid isomerase-like protein